MQVLLTPEAASQLEARKSWWRANRPATADLFDREFLEAVTLVRERAVPRLLRMFEKRLRSYRGIGYARGEAPLGFAEPADDIIVEYDQDVLRALKELDI